MKHKGQDQSTPSTDGCVGDNVLESRLSAIEIDLEELKGEVKNLVQ
jgi:hypothetical protein